MARDPDYNQLLREAHDNWTTAFDYDASNNPIYIGKAKRGSSKADAVWQIKKLTYAGTNVTDVQYPSGDDSYNQIWNNRASLTYS